MNRARFLILIALLCTASATHAQTQSNATASANAASANGSAPAARTSVAAVLSSFDNDIVKAFREAWQRAAAGNLPVEAVVLVVRNADGSCKAVSPRGTNEYRHLTFQWQPGTVAIVHTHPNSNNPKPSATDIELADRFRVPMFTLTISGMFLYDPTTKAISRVQAGVDWLEQSRWTRYAPMMAQQMARPNNADSAHTLRK